MAIRRIPPMITKARINARNAPVIILSNPNDAYIELEMLLICGRLPVPNDERTVAIEKMTAIHLKTFSRLVPLNAFFI